MNSHSNKKSELSSDEQIEQIRKRKKEGIDIPLKQKVQGRENSTLFEDILLMHNALPEIDYDQIDLTTTFLKKKFSAPLIIDSMTGGTDEALIINKRLGEIAEKYGLGMGLGSQRAGLRSDKLVESYSVARRAAPNAFLIANIGGAQLAEGLSKKDVMRIIKMVDANALAIHLNPLQELIQPEGEPRFSGILNKISEIIREIEVPVIVKEVGSGISPQVAIKLQQVGTSSINIAGAGGTSWAGIEKIRADNVNNHIKSSLGELFWDWGIPTALCIILVSRVISIPIISSGGLRNGLEMAKSLILGARMCAMAYPFLRKASESESSLDDFTQLVLAQIKSTMFLVGSSNLDALRNTRYILKDNLASMLDSYELSKRD
jgi:isopentenyl-diphosphate Delta-isomerase